MKYLLSYAPFSWPGQSPGRAIVLPPALPLAAAAAVGVSKKFKKFRRAILSL